MQAYHNRWYIHLLDREEFESMLSPKPKLSGTANEMLRLFSITTPEHNGEGPISASYLLTVAVRRGPEMFSLP
jgi:hypothetical protein